MYKLFIRKVFLHGCSLLSQRMGCFLPLGPVLKKFAVKPVQVNFATTNTCNANCIFCGYRYSKRKKAVMSMEIFKKAMLDFIDIGGGDLGFTPLVGEPFLDPLILERIRFARSFSEVEHIGVVTNGTCLDRFNFEDILSCGLNEIVISFGGFNRETYRRIFGIDEFNRAYENIINLGNLNKKMGNPVKIILSLKLDRPIKYITQEPAYKQIAAVVKDIDYTYKFDSWVGLIKDEELFGIMKIKKPPFMRQPCSIFYAGGPTILEDGSVILCGCRDLEAELILGNIASDSLIALWQSEKLEKLRKDFYLGIIPKICIKCSHYYSLTVYRRMSFRRLAQENYRQFITSRYYKNSRTQRINNLQK